MRDLEESCIERQRGRGRPAGKDRFRGGPRTRQWRCEGTLDRDVREPLPECSDLRAARLREWDVGAALVAPLAIPIGFAVPYEEDVHGENIPWYCGEHDSP
jgi:hypothetical protein